MLRAWQSPEGEFASCRGEGGTGSRGSARSGVGVRFVDDHWGLFDGLRALGSRTALPANTQSPRRRAHVPRVSQHCTQLSTWHEAVAVILAGAFGSCPLSLFVALGCMLFNFFLAWGTLFSCSLAVAAYTVRSARGVAVMRRRVTGCRVSYSLLESCSLCGRGRRCMCRESHRAGAGDCVS